MKTEEGKFRPVSLTSTRAVALNLGLVVPPGDILQCLETSVVVTTGRAVFLASHGEGSGALLNILSGDKELSPQKGPES